MIMPKLFQQCRVMRQASGHSAPLTIHIYEAVIIKPFLWPPVLPGPNQALSFMRLKLNHVHAAWWGLPTAR